MSEQYGATEVTAAPTPSFQLTVKESGVDRVIFGISHAKNAELRLKSLSTSLAYGGVDSRQHLIEEVLTAGLPVGWCTGRDDGRDAGMDASRDALQRC